MGRILQFGAFLGVWAALIAPAHAQTLLVSDLDDTLKLTNVVSHGEVAYRTFIRPRPFAGMAALYRALTARKLSEPGFTLISASPVQIRRLINRFLTARGFPRRALYLRDWQLEPVTQTYKIAKLSEIAGSTRADLLIISDDTEGDPEIFQDFGTTGLAKGRVQAIYIRRVSGRPLPAGVIPFRTAFDVALRELSFGRLSEEAALAVGAATLAAPKDELRPEFVTCANPEPATHLARGARLIALAKKVDRRWARACRED